MEKQAAEQQFEVEISVEKGTPPAEASMLLGAIGNVLLDSVPDSSISRAPKPGDQDAGVLIAVLTHATIVLGMEGIKAWLAKNTARNVELRLSDEAVELFIKDEQMARWVQSHRAK